MSGCVSSLSLFLSLSQLFMQPNPCHTMSLSGVIYGRHDMSQRWDSKLSLFMPSLSLSQLQRAGTAGHGPAAADGCFLWSGCQERNQYRTMGPCDYNFAKPAFLIASALFTAQVFVRGLPSAQQLPSKPAHAPGFTQSVDAGVSSRGSMASMASMGGMASVGSLDSMDGMDSTGSVQSITAPASATPWQQQAAPPPLRVVSTSPMQPMQPMQAAPGVQGLILGILKFCCMRVTEASVVGSSTYLSLPQGVLWGSCQGCNASAQVCRGHLDGFVLF